MAQDVSHAGWGSGVSTSRPIVPRSAPDPRILSGLSELDPITARLFAARGVSDPRLAPVGLLENVDAAVDLLIAKRSSRITVVGDFDVDGATSTVLLLRCLREFGFADVGYLVPNRFEFGYGLTPEIVRIAAERSPALLVTVDNGDNGISSLTGVEEANRLGMPVLVTDHHLPGSEMPDAAVIVNPNLPGSRFPSRNLAGVGVAFYLMAALGRRLEREGLKDAARIRAGKTVAGIEALLRQSGRQLARTASADLGFVAGPRINAAGRLEDISIGIECLLTDDMNTALHHAAILDRINGERRDIESTMREQAFVYVDRMDASNLPACVCVYDESWHQGVVGLIAARVRERCHRPSIAFARESDALLKGSARSIQGVHARDLLEAVHAVDPDVIVKFGGHAMAAGLTIEESRYETFRRLVSEQLERLYPSADFSGAILSDGVLPDRVLNLDFARKLRAAGPWGAGFPEPVWSGDFEVVDQRTVGEKHLKLRVRPADGGNALDAIAFNQAGPAYRGTVQLVYRLDVNEYRGFESAQLVVEQIAPIQVRGA
jgi:single-stranded-DNA-specific exonuclease